jgi:hypothetical protein
MSRPLLAVVGLCALTFAALLPATPASACPDDDKSKDGEKTPSQPSLLACPDDPKKPPQG